ncbi:MAG: PPP family 3-phenylpropionic acid transporter [Myxococcota bacterium]
MRPLSRGWIAALYFASFSVLGAVMPYIALDLKSRGLSGWQMAAAMGMLPLGRLVAGPAWSMLADRLQIHGSVLRIATMLAVAGLVSISTVLGWWASAAMLLLSVGRAPMAPVVDGMALAVLGDDRGSYGRLRRWGSIGFLVSVASVPLLVEHFAIGQLTPGIVLAILAALLTWVLPSPPPSPRRSILPALRVLAKNRSLRWILAAAALHFSAHVAATSFLAVHMDALSLASWWTGAALAAGVVVEIAVMSVSGRLLERFSPERVFLFATALAIVRWLLTTVADSGLALVACQSLHGITFGAFWVAGVALVADRSPKAVATSAQGLLAAAVGGVGSMIGLVGASWVVEVMATRWMFLCGAGIGVLALLCAIVGTRRGVGSPVEKS